MPGVAPDSRMYALPAGSTVTAEGAVRELTTVLTMPGVKTPSEPVAVPSRPWEMLLPEIESKSLMGALRRPRRVGVKRTKTWQVVREAPEVMGPEQELLVTANSEVGATERFAQNETNS